MLAKIIGRSFATNQIVIKEWARCQNVQQVQESLEKFGELRQFKVLEPNDKFQTGLMFAHFQSPIVAREALKGIDREALPEGAKIDYAPSERKRTFSVYVGNLSPRTNKATLQSFFSDCGKSLKTDMPLKKNG